MVRMRSWTLMVRSAARPSRPSVSEAVSERRQNKHASPDDALHRRENHEARERFDTMASSFETRCALLGMRDQSVG